MMFGAANTIRTVTLDVVLKLQNLQSIDGRNFFHPYIQGCGMFLGQALCIFVYLFRLYTNRIVGDYSPMGKKPKVPIRLILIPAFLDFLPANVSYFALNMIPSSVWQVSKGGSIITTAIFTRILLKRVLNKRRVIGCVLASLGITVVGLSIAVFGDKDSETYPVD